MSVSTDSGHLAGLISNCPGAQPTLLVPQISPGLSCDAVHQEECGSNSCCSGEKGTLLSSQHAISLAMGCRRVPAARSRDGQALPPPRSPRSTTHWWQVHLCGVSSLTARWRIPSSHIPLISSLLLPCLQPPFAPGDRSSHPGGISVGRACAACSPLVPTPEPEPWQQWRWSPACCALPPSQGLLWGSLPSKLHPPGQSPFPMLPRLSVQPAARAVSASKQTQRGRSEHPQLSPGSFPFPGCPGSPSQQPRARRACGDAGCVSL